MISRYSCQALNKKIIPTCFYSPHPSGSELWLFAHPRTVPPAGVSQLLNCLNWIPWDRGGEAGRPVRDPARPVQSRHGTAYVYRLQRHGWPIMYLCAMAWVRHIAPVWVMRGGGACSPWKQCRILPQIFPPHVANIMDYFFATITCFFYEGVSPESTCILYAMHDTYL